MVKRVEERIRSTRKLVVLLVEDEPHIVRLVTYILEKEGFTVVTARGGEEALTRAAAERVDLVLLDLMLPEMNGYEVCQHLKQDARTRDIPVVVLSARAQPREVERGYQMGAVGYITKPFEPSTLSAHIKGALARDTASPQ